MLKRSFGHKDLEKEAIVEDSEPEREEARKRRKGERRRRREEQKTKSLQIVELTDSDSPSSAIAVKATETKSTEDLGHKTAHKEHCLNATLPSPVSLKNVMDNSDLSFPEIIEIAPRSNLGILVAKAGIQGIESVQTIILTSSDGDNASDSDLEETSQNMRSKIGRYAFSMTSQGSSIAGRSFRATSVLPDIPKPVPSSSKNPNPISSSYLGFTEHQLNSVLKCVSCNLKWTIRKTAAPKIAHMRSCTKKTCMTDETTRILISREVEANSSVAKQGSKKIVDKEPEQAVEQPPKTFLEQVVKVSDTRRAGKRQKNAPDPTVRVVTETRNEILERARLFLNNPSSSRVTNEGGVAIQPLSKLAQDIRLGNRTALFTLSGDTDAEPPLTQPLPRSGLGAKMAGPSMLGLMDDPPSDLDEPPPTQEIGNSKLASLNRNGPNLLYHDNNMDMVSPYHVPLLEPTNISKEKQEIIYIQDTSVDYTFEDDDTGYDSAVMIFEPEECGHHRPNGNTVHEDRLPTPSSSQIYTDDFLGSTSRQRKLLDGEIGFPLQKNIKKPKKTKRNVDSGLTLEGSHVIPDISIQEKPAQAKSPKKRKTKGNNGVENSDEGRTKAIISDEEFIKKLLNMVLIDTGLYMRILRYEPIHFNVFLEMVREHIIDHNLKDGALRLKLRAFLDKHAVHYYGSEPGGGRNRR